MPSNAKLIEKAQSLAKDLGVDANVKDKSNQELVDEVKRLQAIQSQPRKEDGSDEDKTPPADDQPSDGSDEDKTPPADDQPSDGSDEDKTPPADDQPSESKGSQNDDAPKETKEDKPVIKETKGPKVAKGKAITSKRGILAEGEPISAKDLSGGEEAFKALKSKGFIKG